MNNQTEKEGPVYRVCFAPFKSSGEDGKERLGYSREVGAVWPRRGGKPGAVLRFDIIPVELVRREGVLFLFPFEEPGAEKR